MIQVNKCLYCGKELVNSAACTCTIKTTNSCDTCKHIELCKIKDDIIRDLRRKVDIAVEALEHISEYECDDRLVAREALKEIGKH